MIDVLLNSLTLLLQFLALWRLRVTHPEIKRSRIPGGWIGLFIATILPAAVIILAIYSQASEEGLRAIYWAVAAIVIGAIVYFPIKKYIKPGIPDIDPYVSDEQEVEAV